MDLFVRESGPVGAPTIVFLHGGRMSGWSWEPVVERMQRYHCLVPDLPQYGKSSGRDHSRSTEPPTRWQNSSAPGCARGRAHVVGFSLGAQVGVQLLATEPELVDRAVLCGTIINAMPGVRLTQLAAGAGRRIIVVAVGRSAAIDCRPADMEIPSARIDDYREDMRLMPGDRSPHIVVASAGFTRPEGLDKSDSPTLFLTGAKELPFVRRSAAALAQSNAQRSRQGRNRYGPRLAAALSGPLRPHRRRLAHRYGPASRDRTGPAGSNGSGCAEREAGGAIDRIDDSHVLDRVLRRRLHRFPAQHRRGESVKLIRIGGAPPEALHPIAVG